MNKSKCFSGITDDTQGQGHVACAAGSCDPARGADIPSDQTWQCRGNTVLNLQIFALPGEPLGLGIFLTSLRLTFFTHKQERLAASEAIKLLAGSQVYSGCVTRWVLSLLGCSLAPLP